MSRSGYCDDLYPQELNVWRGAVASAIRGKRGQRLLLALRDALDSMPEKRLIKDELITADGECCALGRLAQVQGINVCDVDPEDRDKVAKLFNIAPALAAEIVYENDEGAFETFHQSEQGEWCLNPETPEQRWERMRKWVEEKINAT